MNKQKNCPTQRAPDKWESARLTGIFLASGLYCSQALSRPAHLRVTQAVGQVVINRTFQSFRFLRHYENDEK